MKPKISGFTPISIARYIDLFLKANPSESRGDVVARLEDAIAAHRGGIRCSCGAELWIMGSAEAGYGCFTCITGESTPDNDYEIETSSAT